MSEYFASRTMNVRGLSLRYNRIHNGYFCLVSEYLNLRPEYKWERCTSAHYTNIHNSGLQYEYLLKISLCSIIIPFNEER